MRNGDQSINLSMSTLVKWYENDSGGGNLKEIGGYEMAS